MSVKAFDVNSDYVLVAWKPPNTTNEAAIIGYFVDRSVLTTFHFLLVEWSWITETRKGLFSFIAS